MTNLLPQLPRSRWSVLALTALTLILVLYVVWRLDTEPRTDDAYASADTIDVVPEVSGRIIKLAVNDNQSVKKGDLLFQIDPRQYQDELNRAKASLVALDKQIALTQRSVNAQKFNSSSAHAMVERARATAAQTASTLKRTEPLLNPGYVSADEVERARSAQRAAEAELLSAQFQAQQAAAAVSGVDALVAQRDVILAEIALAALHLEQTRVYAPFNGRVVSLNTTIGQYASAMKPVFTLIDTEHWYVIANFRETELGNIRRGTPATVYLMSNGQQHFQGKVDSIGFGVLPDDGGKIVNGLPQVQRTINWVRVAQRFPVKIIIEKPNPELFRIGASAVAKLLPENAPASR